MKIVEELLVQYPALRDSDDKLTSTVWFRQLPEFSETWDGMRTDEFLRFMYSGKLFSAEAITRCRRKVQEIRPDLRGVKYNERKKKVKKYPQELNQN